MLYHRTYYALRTNKSVSNDIQAQASLICCIRSTIFSVQYGGLSTKSQIPHLQHQRQLGQGVNG